MSVQQMESYVETLGDGNFTCGSTYICFLPKGSTEYVKLAQCPSGMDDTPEWTTFSEVVVDLLNVNHRKD